MQTYALALVISLVLADSFAVAGLRGLVGKVNMDQNSPE